MPYEIITVDGKKCVVKQGETEPLGCHATLEDAQAQMAALYASESKSIAEYLDALKVGRRNNANDAKALQAIHDTVCGLGAECNMDNVPRAVGTGKAADATLVSFGAEVKALGDGRVGGYLVRYSTPADTDITGDYFTPATDFGDAQTSDVYYHHAMDAKMGGRVLAKATMRKDDVGVWVEAQLQMRDDYEKAIYALAQKGRLGWSSGTAAHLVERRPSEKGAHEITRWPLGLDASLTPTPAEPRNGVMALKAWADAQRAGGLAGLDDPATLGEAHAAGESFDIPESQKLLASLIKEIL